MNKTSEVLAAMLKENTGSHMLDSGGIYGRNWQRNQDRDFDAESRAILKFESWRDHEVSVNLTHNVYHWLLERFEYDSELDSRLQQIIEDSDRYTSYGECIEIFLDQLRDNEDNDLTGLYGDSDPIGDNTYNHESLLSQVLQYTYFELNNTPYVILQIHGGCDVRGGYTAPKVFSCNDDAAIFYDADGSIYCDNRECSASWFTDDAYHWYSDNRDLDFADLRVIVDSHIDLDSMDYTTYTVKRFGVEFFNRWADRRDWLAAQCYRVAVIPSKLLSRLESWFNRNDPSTRVLKVSAYKYNKPIRGKAYHMSHRWVYDPTNPKLAALAKRVKDRITPKVPQMTQRVLYVINEDHAVCPVCGSGRLSA